jgi:hypothetical protein
LCRDRFNTGFLLEPMNVTGSSDLCLETAGAAADGNVTLVSLTVFQMHKRVFKRDVYFKCQGEGRRYFPNVKDKDHL